MFLYKRSNGYYYAHYRDQRGKWKGFSTRTRNRGKANPGLDHRFQWRLSRKPRQDEPVDAVNRGRVRACLRVPSFLTSRSKFLVTCVDLDLSISTSHLRFSLELVMRKFLLLAGIVLLPFNSAIGAKSGYYRFPSIHGQTIIFTSEGDLWVVRAEGGVAQRLTTHLGVESYAAISPDGKLLAFSAQYEGPTEVYTMPVEGGLPTRRTYDGEMALVVGWTPDGKVLYATRHYSTLPDWQVVRLDLMNHAREIIPLSQASDGCYGPSGKVFFFTRLPFQGSHTKRYQGGTAQNIWKFVVGSAEAIPLTNDYRGTSKIPMVWNGRIYFASDRDGTMNIWSMTEGGSDLRQHTFHKGWDVKSPSLGGGRIVYQVGADIHIFDIAGGQDGLVPITLASDFEQTREKWVKKPAEYLTSVALSPDGDRVVLTARGQVFVAPAQEGRFVTAAAKERVRFRAAKFMPDGKSLFVLSDETGELEFWKYPANGIGAGEALTKDGNAFRFEGEASPDGKWIAFADKNNTLWLVNIAEKKSLQIDSSEVVGGFGGMRWSPDSRWLAYVEYADNLNGQIKLYSTETKATTLMTSDRVSSYDPAWSPDGQWLYFLSDRRFQSLVLSPWGARQPEPYFDRTTKIYAISLKKEIRFPFAPDDELMPRETDAKKTEEQSKDKEKQK